MKKNLKREAVQLKFLKALQVSTSVILASVLVVSGCSSKKEGGQSPGSGQSPSQQVKSGNETKDFVDISWYMRKPIDNEKDQEAVEAEANKIFKDKINANLHLKLIDVASWEEKMRVMSSAGESYDIAFTGSGTNRIDMNVEKGAFLPLDDLLQRYGQDILKKVDPRAWKAVTYNGKIMAIPAQAPYSMPWAYVFKKELVDKYGFDYKKVKSLQDLEPYLETIKKNEPTITPLLPTNIPGLMPLDYIVLTNGVLFDEKNGKLVINIDIPEYVNNLRKMNEYYKKGYIAKDAAVKKDFMAEAKSGKYAVLRDSGGYTEDGSKSTGMFGFPCVESLYGYPIITTGSMASSANAISKTSKNPERAMMLLNLIWKDKYLSNTLAYGVEGKNYTVKSGKGTDNPSVEAKSGAEQTWAIWHNWVGPLWDQWDSNWNTTKALETMQKNNETAKTSALLGFIFNPEPVKSEIAQVTAVTAEVTPVLNTGSMPDFDKYISDMRQKLKNAGIDKIMNEAQKQIDAWKTQNSK
jgi:putative aldouronate transport system substrate-binding protein